MVLAGSDVSVDMRLTVTGQRPSDTRAVGGTPAFEMGTPTAAGPLSTRSPAIPGHSDERPLRGSRCSLLNDRDWGAFLPDNHSHSH